ncbi:MAG: DUF2961 domain-containing protein [Candidatus Solibacter usitatus]|nr:DUF2961 domain-containing protein [Candidatus Solibacter usitatus]
MSGLLGWGGLALGAAAAQRPRGAPAPPPPPADNPSGLGQLHRARTGKRRRVSSFHRGGKNADAIPIEAGQLVTLADLKGAGCVRHVWMTISSAEPDYLRRLVLRAHWDGETNPSIESPVGDFFGVGHARVSNYWSLPLNMVTGGNAERNNQAAMNCFFPMPFGSAARLTVENQGEKAVSALYYYVDYESYDRAPADALRFHAQWRREKPTKASLDLAAPGATFAKINDLANLDGVGNYVILDAVGRGHYAGCTLSIDHINPIPNFGWFGEGDDMIFIDGDKTPTLSGTGTEDYFCAAWGFPGGQNSMPYHGVSLAGATEGPAAYSGKWSMYRFHVEDPVMFEKSIRVTIEAGHANVHANDYSSVGYWYQAEPHRAFPPLAPAAERLPLSASDSMRLFWRTR